MTSHTGRVAPPMTLGSKVNGGAHQHQLGPRYEGQRMAEPKPPSDQSSPYSLTTVSSHVLSDRRAVTDMNGERRGRCVAHHFNAVCGDGGGVRRGPRTATSFGPQHELPPARLVIHRTDLCP